VTSKLASFVCLRIHAYTFIYHYNQSNILLMHDWSKCISWYLIPECYSPIFKTACVAKNIWGIIHVNLVLKAHSFHCSLLRTVRGQLSKHMFVSSGDFFIYNMTVPDITPWYHLISQWILQHQQVLCKLVIFHCHHSLPNKWSKLQICIDKYVRFW